MTSMWTDFETSDLYKINVLQGDLGFIRLVDFMGGDISVVRSARVSYDAEWRAGEDEKGDTKLIRYLWTHAHTTPFEAATMTFEVKAPIFVFRQWHRHRTQSYNELSARYRELPADFFVPDMEDLMVVQSKDNKQGRTPLPPSQHDVMWSQREEEREQFIDHCEDAFILYKKLLEADWPRETARAVLPIGTYSHMFCTMNLLNAFRFMTLRLDPHAQKEIRVYAEGMLKLLKPIYPVCCKAFQSVKFIPTHVETAEAT